MDPLPAYLRLAPRERAAVLRAYLELNDIETMARLAAEPTTGLLVTDLHAEALLLKDRPMQALAVVERREQQRISTVSVGLRTRALAKLGRVDEARAAIDASGEPGSYLARSLIGEAFLEANDAATARRELEAAVALEPHRRRALLGLVRALDALDDQVTASAYAARLLATQDDDLGPLNARYLTQLREFYARSGETNRVVELDGLIATRHEEAKARIATLLAGERPAPKTSPAKSAAVAAERAAERAALPTPTEAAPTRAGPPVTDEERANVAALVKRHVGFDTLRAGQAETMARVLRNEDVLAVMPTGGGKSICYQLPGALSEGVTLIVSPLIALMKDQLDSLPAPMRAAAVSITSELTPAQARGVLRDVAQRRYRLVYVAPERLRNAPLLSALRAAGVARLVVDEAHCVSVWGHDFRPDYLGISEARRNLGDPPILAVTATAPPRVARDILQRLGDLTVVRGTIDRPNLRFEAVQARDADDKLAHLYKLCQETPGPGIVYATSRAKCEQLAAALHSAGLRADAYHAGLPDRTERQERFMNGDTEVLVATVAFGMGVDKGDIRYVIHHDPSSSVENYYQESGRAGRDGQAARCVLLATAQDGGTLKQRARGDLPTRDLIGHVWASVLARREEGQDVVLLPLDDLADLGDGVKPRVALSILTESGTVERLADVPLRFRVHAKTGPLREVGPGNLTVFDIARLLAITPESVEAALLEGESEGRLTFQSTGRGQLLRVDGDTSRVESVLERYAALAEQRGKEMMDYAKTDRCRRQYLRAYFGEEGPDACGNCDTCLGIMHEAADIPGGDEESAARAVLAALGSMRGIGQLNLVYLLRGDARAPEWVVGKPGYGALAFRSESKVRAVIERLLAAELIGREQLPHGGMTLQLSQEGARALNGGDAVMPEATRAPAPSRRASNQDDGETPLDADAARRFDALKVWRRGVAGEEGVPPYVVSPDKAMRAVAAANPKTEAALLAVKGMGPKRVEKYGKAILDVLGN